jgi:hypothetical protein
MEVDGISTDPIDPVFQDWLQDILIFVFWIDGPAIRNPSGLTGQRNGMEGCSAGFPSHAHLKDAP